MRPLGLDMVEPFNQSGNILDPLRQRRQVNRNRVEAMIQVGAKRTSTDRPVQVAVGGRDYPDVYFDGPVTPNAFEAFVLQNMQQFRLKIDGQLSDFVQKNGAPVRHFKATRTRTHSAGERAFGVAEQLALEQAGRKRRAVDLDEQLSFSWAETVDMARHEILAGARLAGDQHTGV